MPPRREPVRTCVACREEAGRRTLLRFVRGPDGLVTADPDGREPGRGAYLHDSSECRSLAQRRRSLERSLKGTVPPGLWTGTLIEGTIP